jgi:hypothetical protein
MSALSRLFADIGLAFFLGFPRKWEGACNFCDDMASY